MGFAAGFSAGYNAVTKAREEEEKRKERKLKAQREQALKVKEDNQAMFSEAESNITKIGELKIKHEEAKQKIMTDENYDEEGRAKAINNINRVYSGEIKRYTELAGSKTQQITDEKLFKPLAGMLSELNQSSNFSTFSKVEIGDKSTYITDEQYEQYLENPEQYTMGKDNNLYLKDKDGNTTNQLFAQGVSFKGNVKEEDKSFKELSFEDWIKKPENKGKGRDDFELAMKQAGKTTVNVNMSDGEQSSINSADAIKILNKDTNKITTEDVDKLWQYERDFLKNNATEKEKTTYSQLENSVNTIDGLKRTRDLFKDLVENKGIKGGIAQDIAVGIMTYIGSGGVMSDLTNITPEKFAEITGLESAFVSQQMEIIRDLSGLSYTDKQMQVLQKITSSKAFKTNESKINAINGYIARIQADATRLAKDNKRFARKFPHLAYSLKSRPKDVAKPSAKNNNNPKEEKPIGALTTGQSIYLDENNEPYIYIGGKKQYIDKNKKKL